MEQITAEQALAIIRKYQDTSLIGLDINDGIASFKAQMAGHPYAYLSEASVTEPSSDEANRLGKLLQTIKPEIDSIGTTPRYFNILILVSDDAMLMMDEMNALHDFICEYDGAEVKWSINAVDGASNMVKILIITIAD